jgi:drug/metabolite transporter (DMT)-like permease
MPLASLACLVLLAAIWGASFLFLRIGVPVFGPGKLIALRVGLAAVFLLVVARLLKKPLAWRGNLRHFFIMGVLNSALPGYSARAHNHYSTGDVPCANCSA